MLTAWFLKRGYSGVELRKQLDPGVPDLMGNYFHVMALLGGEACPRKVHLVPGPSCGSLLPGCHRLVALPSAIMLCLNIVSFLPPCSASPEFPFCCHALSLQPSGPGLKCLKPCAHSFTAYSCYLTGRANAGCSFSRSYKRIGAWTFPL